MSEAKKISLIMLTHNEGELIQKNLAWINKCRSIDEIIFVDDNSTDNTTRLIKSLNLKNQKVHLFKRNLDNDFSSQRQFAITKTKNNNILWLDPDEQPSKEMLVFLNHIGKHKYVNYSFLRSDLFLGHVLKHGETSSQYFLRLFDKRFGHFSNKVHEVWHSTMSSRNLNIKINHQPHPTLKTFIQKINFYTDIRSHELLEKGVKTNIFEIVIYPLTKFFNNYFLRLGFLDGTPGIIIALGMSFHSFLVRSKLWTLQKQ